MVSVTPIGIKVLLKLNNGTDSQGNVKTVALNLGNINMAKYNADKAWAIALALSPCLAKSLVNIHEVKTSILASS